jgi:hypothetical protein
MAKLILKGRAATVSLDDRDEDGGVIARCVGHRAQHLTSLMPGACGWTETYDNLNDAAEYASDHADTGRMS